MPKSAPVRSVAIVDDEATIRETVEYALAREGYRTCVHANGVDAWESFQKTLPDLVILDIRMAGMDGVEALQRILDRDNTLPVILNTAYSSYRENFMTWSADAYVTKSADVDELIDTVKSLLQQRLVEN